MKPQKVLLFLIITLCSLGIASKLLPLLHIQIGDTKIEALPDFTEQFDTKIDSSAYIAEIKAQEAKMSLQEKKEAILMKPHRSTQDTLILMQVEAMESPAKFYFANDDHSAMDKFFAALEQAQADNTTFRMIHYGDSQIEMDRISSFIREQLQKQYGGSGMGLLPALEVTPKYTVAVQSQGSWNRRLTFGGNENRAKHNRYGPMAYFCKKESSEASVTITARENTSFKNRHFTQCRLLIGAIDQALTVQCEYAGKTISNTINPSSTEQLIVFKTDSAQGKITLKFSGANADVLGIALDGPNGVSVDNIPMRGCSGTVFRRINAETLKRSYQLLGVKALILQFGGNALPGMTKPSSAEAYGKKFYEEIRYLKSIDPNLFVFVIGPADMSIRQNGQWVTHPQLENVRNALRKATLDNGGVFWDMYEAMGGNGSMVEWVNNKPALGSPDYIHFSQRGADKIAQIFYQSLLKEQDMYQLRKKIQ